MRRALPLTIIALTVVAGTAAMSTASPADKVTASLLARGTFDDGFKVRSAGKSPVDLSVTSKAPLDLLVRRHEYQPGGYTGWHSHPGPVFITVTRGSLTFYTYDDGTCRRKTLTADPATGYQPAYLDDGRGHFVRNESGEVAEDVSVITAPTNKGAFRGEQGIPDGCGF